MSAWSTADWMSSVQVMLPPALANVSALGWNSAGAAIRSSKSSAAAACTHERGTLQAPSPT